MENQISLFDQVYLSFHDCFCSEKTVRPKRKRRSKVKKEESSSSELNSLLPYLFPEDFPELQEQIDSINVIWTDEDVALMEQEILFSTINVLLDYRSGIQSRDEAYAWLMNDDFAPFSYRACVSSTGARAEAFRSSVCSRLVSERRFLCRAQELTKRQKAYLDWITSVALPDTDFEEMTGIESLAWLDELDKGNQRVASLSGYF